MKHEKLERIVEEQLKRAQLAQPMFRYDIAQSDLGDFRNTTINERVESLDPDGFEADERTGDAILRNNGWKAKKTPVS